MTHRERFRRTAARQKADRAVYDLSGSPNTKIDYDVTRDGLAKLLGIHDPCHRPYDLDERVLAALDIDTRRIGGMPIPPTKHIREEGGVVYNAFGLGSRFVNGHYEFCHYPLQGCTMSQLEDYELPAAKDIDLRQIERWAQQARHLHEKTDYAVVAEHCVFGVMEIGCWLFGYDDYLYRMAAEPELVRAFHARFLDFQKQVIEVYYGALGGYIDCTLSSDDFGTQTGPFLSAAMFGDLVAPYMKERIAHTRKHTGAFIQQHTCGAVYPLIPSLIDCGIDILNPIQPGAFMMEPERLKRDFGDRLAFWGGIDTQRLLPLGTPEEVRREVRRILEIFQDTGGYILAPAHTIQQDVPPENVLAIYRIE